VERKGKPGSDAAPKQAVGRFYNRRVGQVYTDVHSRALAGAAAVLAALSGNAAWSQTGRPIKFVVPYPPGGGNDILARLLAEQIGRTQRLTIVVENRPGAGLVIGTEAASRAAPDGNTVLITDPTFVIRPHLQKLNYDPLTSFEPICNLVATSPLIAVNHASPYRTLADLIDAARARPGELTIASDGPATVHHVMIEMFKRAAKVDMNYIPYAGGSPALNALLGQHVTAVLLNYPVLAEQIKAGKLRGLATTLRTRIESLPDVPTVAESGYMDYVIDAVEGAVAPAKTPKDVVSRLASWFTAALQAPDLRPKLAVQGFYPVGICGTDFAAFLREQFDQYGRAIREANIKAE
jgi:tripartite-type tricarboxylate transporter receptor subunit TctC